MDRLRALHYFTACASEGSFSRAAHRLGVSTAAVSKLIAALEKDLGIVIFERSARGLLMTAAGHRYLQACEPALATLAQADEEARGFTARPKGTLVVGIQHTVARGCLTAALPRFHARHPEIELDVRDVQHVSDETAAGVDVTVVVGWPKVEQLVNREVAASRFVVAAAPSYWAAHGIPQHPRDLAGHTCLSIRGVEGTLLDRWSFERGEEREAVAVTGWLTVSNAHRDVVLDLALRGHGVVRLLDWANASELTSGLLVPALQDWESPEAPPVNVIYASQLRRVARARAFIDFVIEVFADIDAARGRRIRPTERPMWLRRHYGKASEAREAPDPIARRSRLPSER